MIKMNKHIIISNQRTLSFKLGKLKEAGLKTTSIVSNFFSYNNNDEIIDYQRPIIHSLNKTEETAENIPYYDQTVSKKI